MDVIGSHAARLPALDERWTPRAFGRAELIEGLLAGMVAGPEVTHPLDNVLRNIRLLHEGDPDKQFGLGGLGYRPLVGEWGNQGFDAVGLYVPSSATFFLKFSSSSGAADVSFIYGSPGAEPLSGDWDGSHTSLVRIESEAPQLRNSPPQKRVTKTE